ncbi:hypothetical protein GGR50DRAFT_684421 [Xylaria sp. CBS 124048]|nr:hypothetical protein GGR50DRAFT_684421 [Xylaria sp. CBS 124048]
MSQSVLPSVLKLNSSPYLLFFITVCAFVIPVALLLPPVALRRSDALLKTHTRAGVSKSKSNLKDQYAATSQTSQDGPALVKSLVIYPVKSCRGIELTHSRVVPQGLEYDRMFTFAQLKSPFPVSLNMADEAKAKHRWVFITQREFPLLATVKADLWLPDETKLRKQSADDTSKDAFLILRFPWRDDGWRGLLSVIMAKLSRGLAAEAEKEILLPIAFPSPQEIKEKGYVLEEVKIWNDVVTALNMTTELPRELMLYLGTSNKLGLFRVNPSKLREVYRCAPRKDDVGYQPVTGFQDAYPLHLITLDTVQEFSKEVPKDDQLKQLDVTRFRANIILSGVPAYDEETWKQARFKPGRSNLRNDAVFHVSCRTARCKMPNVNPETGDRHPREPDRSLRRLRIVDKGAPLWGCLGMQMTPLFEAADNAGDSERFSWIAVGMAVEVEQRGDHVYIPQ